MKALLDTTSEPEEVFSAVERIIVCPGSPGRRARNWSIPGEVEFEQAVSPRHARQLLLQLVDAGRRDLTVELAGIPPGVRFLGAGTQTGEFG
jgi:hypothetical protein